MATTIQITNDLKEALSKRKINDSDTYEDIIWDLIEDTMEVNEETKRDIETSLAQIKAGKFYTLEQVKKELGLSVRNSSHAKREKAAQKA